MDKARRSRAASRPRSPADGWVIALADMPAIRLDTIRRVAEALRTGATTAAPVYRGQRGHPVGFAKLCRSELLALDGDTGARAAADAAPPAAHRGRRSGSTVRRRHDGGPLMVGLMQQWWKLALSASEIALSAPQVVRARTARLTTAPGLASARNRREAVRMVSEKWDAGLAGQTALWQAGWQMQQQLLNDFWAAGPGAAITAPGRQATGPARRADRARAGPAVACAGPAPRAFQCASPARRPIADAAVQNRCRSSISSARSR